MDYIDKIPIVKEMRAVGLGNPSILIFATIGLAIWAILVWMFSMRLDNLVKNTENDKWAIWDSSEPLKNITIIILSFHVITFLLTILESSYLSQNVWISWFTIGLAVSAIFLNASSVAITILDDDEFSGSTLNPLPDSDMAIASLVLQCMGVSLMTAYLFKIIRSKRKTTY